MTRQEVSADRIQRIDEEFARRVRVAVQSGDHLWIATLAYFVADSSLDTLAETPVMFDVENLAMRPAIGCYVCEQPYSVELRRRRCRPSSDALRAMRRDLS